MAEQGIANMPRPRPHRPLAKTHHHALIWLSIIGGICLSTAAAALPRDKLQKDEFRRTHPCPSTGKTRGSCPGYEVDHKQALMNGGADKPSNMQWLSHQDHKTKTAIDVAQCKRSFTCKSKRLRKPLPWSTRRDHKRKGEK